MSDSNVLVVGASQGIGRALCKRLVAAGHQVVGTSRSPDQYQHTGVHYIRCDVQAEQMEFDVEQLPERLDGVVYCPGTITLKPFHRLASADFRHDYSINVQGAVEILQICLSRLKKSDRASVVLFSTVAVETGMPFHASIAAAKGAVEALTRSLAAEWAPRIRVNAIAPSLTQTQLAEKLIGNEKQLAAAEQRHPLKQIGQPDDIAALAEYLLSVQSKFVTGQILKADGGLSALRLF